MNSEEKQLMAAVVAAKDMDQQEGTHGSSRGPNPSAQADPPASELRTQRFEPGDLLSNPLPVVSLQQHAPVDVSFEQRMDFDVTRGGDAAGVALWLHEPATAGIRDDHQVDATTAETISGAHRHVLFSWPAVVQVTAGDTIRLSLKTEQSDHGCEWHWDSLIRKIVSGRIQGIRYQRTTHSPLTLLNGVRR